MSTSNDQLAAEALQEKFFGGYIPAEPANLEKTLNLQDPTTLGEFENTAILNQLRIRRSQNLPWIHYAILWVKGELQIDGDSEVSG